MGVAVKSAAAGLRDGVGSFAGTGSDRPEAGENTGEVPGARVGRRSGRLFGFRRNIARVQDIDGVLRDAEQESPAGRVDYDHRGLLANALAADDGKRTVCPPTPGALP